MQRQPSSGAAAAKVNWGKLGTHRSPGWREMPHVLIHKDQIKTTGIPTVNHKTQTVCSELRDDDSWFKKTGKFENEF